MTGTFSQVPQSSWLEVLATVRPPDPDSGLGCDRDLPGPPRQLGPGCKLQTGPGPWVGFAWPTQNFLMNGANMKNLVDVF